MVTRSRPNIDDPMSSFCKDVDAYLQGAANGPLADLTFAAKDIFDVAGHVTGGGNPDWKATHRAAGRTAWAIQVLVDAGATMVGKTVTDELTRAYSGRTAITAHLLTTGARSRSRRIVERVGLSGGRRTGRLCPGLRYWWLRARAGELLRLVRPPPDARADSA